MCELSWTFVKLDALFRTRTTRERAELVPFVLFDSLPLLSLSINPQPNTLNPLGSGKSTTYDDSCEKEAVEAVRLRGLSGKKLAKMLPMNRLFPLPGLLPPSAHPPFKLSGNSRKQPEISGNTGLFCSVKTF